ncbi:hypothetical protein L596_021392 [Steinernema carpocapsae]|uniref:Uncharacterized protein n=1 Tax=Steinernema carpocapsae TaxID=34508 RepID=A0A4U5MIM7_STECR|nr:hypothetical protein L596_021392 [Steinernema carpocapsae]
MLLFQIVVTFDHSAFLISVCQDLFFELNCRYSYVTLYHTLFRVITSVLTCFIFMVTAYAVSDLYIQIQAEKLPIIRRKGKDMDGEPETDILLMPLEN